MNNPTSAQITQLVDEIFPQCLKYACQEETGEKEDTPHIQGYLYFKSAKTFSAVKKQLPTVHLEKARNKHAAAKYCLKNKTRTGRQWILGYGANKRARRDPLEGVTMYPWQEEIMSILADEPAERTIHWYWESKGKSGKTSLAIHICLTCEDAIYINGKAADMKCAIMEMKDPPSVCIIDLTRSREAYVSYSGMEEIKNGIFFSGKYKSGMKMFEPPHLIVFANFSPCIDKLSLDRWNIVNITPDLVLDKLAPE